MPRRSVRHRRDEGMDLHELRDLRPGDPFRRIAWKASARTGKLVVREPEREEMGSLDIVLDASATLREGVPGDRRIDRAASVVVALADEALSRGQRVGFVAVDRRVIARVPADGRSDQRGRIVDALVNALSCVDEDRTLEDDGAVGRLVARYLRFQEGVDYLDPRVRDGVHLERLALHVVSRAKGHHEVHATSPAGRIIRRYAELMGIPLSPRRDRDGPTRSNAIAQGLAELSSRRAAPSRVVLVTDGRDVDFDGRLRSQLARLRRHGHGLEVVLVRTTLPRARELGLSPTSELVLTHAEDDVARLRAVSVRLRARGISSTVEPDYPSARRVA